MRLSLTRHQHHTIVCPQDAWSPHHLTLLKYFIAEACLTHHQLLHSLPGCYPTPSAPQQITPPTPLTSTAMPTQPPSSCTTSPVPAQPVCASHEQLGKEESSQGHVGEARSGVGAAGRGGDDYWACVLSEQLPRPVTKRAARAATSAVADSQQADHELKIAWQYRRCAADLAHAATK